MRVLAIRMLSIHAYTGCQLRGGKIRSLNVANGSESQTPTLPAITRVNHPALTKSNQLPCAAPFFGAAHPHQKLTLTDIRAPSSFALPANWPW
jgi:hypothetical protein